MPVRAAIPPPIAEVGRREVRPEAAAPRGGTRLGPAFPTCPGLSTLSGLRGACCHASPCRLRAWTPLSTTTACSGRGPCLRVGEGDLPSRWRPWLAQTTWQNQRPDPPSADPQASGSPGCTDRGPHSLHHGDPSPWPHPAPSRPSRLYLQPRDLRFSLTWGLHCTHSETEPGPLKVRGLSRKVESCAGHTAPRPLHPRSTWGWSRSATAGRESATTHD